MLPRYTYLERLQVNEKPSTFVALKYRNFRLLWLGQLVSMSGSMMQMVAILWHISLLVPPDQKSLALGLVGLVRVFPIIVLSLVSGVVADVLDRRKLMLVTQVGMTIVATVLAALSYLGLTVAWPIYALAALSSAVGAFDGPARQSLIPALVPRENLPNAISLNTLMFQFAAVLGPALGGIVIATMGVTAVYAFNALSFLAVIAALLLMRDLPAREESNRSEISLGAAVEGLRFVFTSPLIRATMLLDFSLPSFRRLPRCCRSSPRTFYG